MKQFHAAMRERVMGAVTSLDEARDNGDDHLVEVRIGELQSLAHLATEHDLHVPELDPFTDEQAR